MDHDALSKLLFGLSIVMADALRIIVGAWVRHLELGNLERLPAEHGGLGPHRVGGSFAAMLC